MSYKLLINMLNKIIFLYIFNHVSSTIATDICYYSIVYTMLKYNISLLFNIL